MIFVCLVYNNYLVAFSRFYKTSSSPGTDFTEMEGRRDRFRHANDIS